MNNITVQLEPKTVQKIVEDHINKNLAPDKQAAIVTITGTYSTSASSPGLPNYELSVTFNVVDRR